MSVDRRTLRSAVQPSVWKDATLPLTDLERLQYLLASTAASAPANAQLPISGSKLTVSIDGEKPIAWPLTEPRARALFDAEHPAEPAASNRKSVTFTPERVTLGEVWGERFEQTLPDIALMLGFVSGTHRRTEFEGFELHAPGEFVPPTPTDDDAVGQVLVLMRSPRQGAAVSTAAVANDDRGHANTPRLIAYRSGEAPSFTPLEGGHLAVMRFKLFADDAPVSRDATIEQATLLLATLFTGSSSHRAFRSALEKLILPLSRDYAKGDLCYGFLEQHDTELISILGAAADRVGCEWMLARGAVPGSELAYARHSAMELEWWNDKECPGTIELIVRENEVVDPFGLVVSRDSHWHRYSPSALPFAPQHVSALVLIPRETSDHIRTKVRPFWALESARNSLKWGIHERATSLLDSLVAELRPTRQRGPYEWDQRPSQLDTSGWEYIDPALDVSGSIEFVEPTF